LDWISAKLAKNISIGNGKYLVNWEPKILNLSLQSYNLTANILTIMSEVQI